MKARIMVEDAVKSIQEVCEEMGKYEVDSLAELYQNLHGHVDDAISIQHIIENNVDYFVYSVEPSMQSFIGDCSPESEIIDETLAIIPPLPINMKISVVNAQRILQEELEKLDPNTLISMFEACFPAIISNTSFVSQDGGFIDFSVDPETEQEFEGALEC